MRFVFMVLALLVATPVWGQTKSEEVYTPAGQWISNWAEDRCRLLREFEDGDGNQAVLYFEQYGTSPDFVLVFATDYIKQWNDRDSIALQLGEFGPRELLMQTGELGSFKGALFLASVRPALEDVDVELPETDGLSGLDPSEGSRIEFVSFSSERSTVRVETGSVEDVFAALNKCAADLSSARGFVDLPERQPAVQPEPRNFLDLAKTLQSAYPTEALRAGGETSLRVRLLVDAKGRVQACEVVAMASMKFFGDLPCDIVRRSARFIAAKDEVGRPMPSIYTTTIHYQMK